MSISSNESYLNEIVGVAEFTSILSSSPLFNSPVRLSLSHYSIARESDSHHCAEWENYPRITTLTQSGKIILKFADLSPQDMKTLNMWYLNTYNSFTDCDATLRLKVNKWLDIDTFHGCVIDSFIPKEIRLGSIASSENVLVVYFNGCE